MFDAVSRIYEKVCVVGLVAGAALILGQMGYGFVNVIFRYVFNSPVPGTIEFTGEAMIYIVFLPAAYVQMRRRHVRIDFFYNRTTPKGRNILDIMAYAIGIVFFSLIVWYSIEPAFHSLKIKETSWGTVPFPLYPQRFALIVGAAMLLGQLLLDIVRPIKELASRRNPKSQRNTDEGGLL